jgi:hypothetical protein
VGGIRQSNESISGAAYDTRNKTDDQKVLPRVSEARRRVACQEVCDEARQSEGGVRLHISRGASLAHSCSHLHNEQSIEYRSVMQAAS